MRSEGRCDYLIAAIVAGLIGVFLLSRAVSGSPLVTRERDVLFSCPGHHDLRTTMSCATQVFFNGDWRGAAICHGQRCWQYAELFPEAR